MYPITNAVKALFDADNAQVLRITGTDRNGAIISITDADVLQNGFSIDRYCCNGDKLEIGTAVAAEMTLRLNNADGKFNDIYFEGTELTVEVGIADWTAASPTVSWVPCGVFIPDEQPRALSTITIHALDRMMYFDETSPTLYSWTDHNGNNIADNYGNTIYFAVGLTFPATVQSIITQVCGHCNVPFTQSISGFPNYNFSITSLPEISQTITYRNLIQWCAGLMGTNAWIDWTGNLRFSWYNNSTGYVTTKANRYDSDFFENDLSITGVKYTNLNGQIILSGSDVYSFDLTGNYLAENGVAQMLSAIKNRVNGYTYRPFMASVFNAPYLWPMDLVTFTDKDGGNHTSVLTNVRFGLNTVTVIESRGMTALSNKSSNQSNTTTEQAALIEQAVETTRELNRSLTQEEIFNRLTDNGVIQGLLLYNGKVYLNADYVRSGRLGADHIDATELHVNAANVDGTLTIGQLPGDVATEAEVTIITNNTISTTNVLAQNLRVNMANVSGTLSASNIVGGTLTLGGLNDENGILQIADGNNQLIGSWKNDGITIEKGSITLTGFSSGNNTTLVSISEAPWYPIMIDKQFPDGKYVTTKIGSFSYHEGINIQTQNDSGSGTASFGTQIIIRHNSSDTTLPSIHLINENSSTYSQNVEIDGDGIFLYALQNLVIQRRFQTSISGAYTTLYGSFTVTGTKSRAVTTDQYAKRLLYCYETPSPMFGDVGEGVIGEDGLCYVTLDAIFAQTVNTGQYQVFLQRYGEGDCWVKERKPGWFVVQGEPGLSFGWEIKAKQRDFDQLRLERDEKPFAVPNQTYGDDAAKHIEELRKERESA